MLTTSSISLTSLYRLSLTIIDLLEAAHYNLLKKYLACAPHTALSSCLVPTYTSPTCKCTTKIYPQH
jgi:hypothetical protein